MLYSSLTNDELERWVYASPNDGMALVELIKRGPKMARGESDRVAEAEADLAMQEETHKGELNATMADLHATEERLRAAEMSLVRYQTAIRSIVHVGTTVDY